MMSPKKGSRQAMKHPSTIRIVLETRRTIVFLMHHTGAYKSMNPHMMTSNNACNPCS